MALDPETIKIEREKIPQFYSEGTIVSSALIKKGENRCIDTYESFLNAGSEKIAFQYYVNGPSECDIDSIYDIEPEPFVKNVEVSLSLTQEKPHFMVASEVSYTPESQSSSTVFIIGAALFFIVVLSIFLVTKRSRLRIKNNST